MNREWMLEKLKTFKALCEEYTLEDRRAGDRYTERQRELTDEMTLRMPTVREILKRLSPELASQVKQPQYLGGTSDSLRAVQEGIGVLRDQDEWAVNLAPDAPSLVADQLHPHVWAAAAALWDTRQYRVAVQQAAVSLSAHIASRAGTSLAERELVNQVFSLNEPSSTQVRLHFSGDKTNRTWRSRQDGLHLLAQGAFAGIRNVATHTQDEWSEQVALEHLAVLSVIARWTDETELARPN